MDNNSGSFLSTQRVSSIVYVLISNKYATYKELRDDYNLDEALNLYEICMINLYNKIKSYESINRK